MNTTGELAATAEPSNAWDRQLTEIGGHLLQSRRWGAFKERHGWSARRIFISGPAGTVMAQLLYRFRGPISVGYIPRGPAMSGDPVELWPLLLQHVDSLARRNRAIMTLIEPNVDLALPGSPREAGVVRGPGHLQPGRTVRVPLADDDALLQQMHPKTRYSVQLAHRRAVIVERPAPGQAAIEAFYRLLEDTARRNKFGIHSLAYYEDFLHLFADDAVLLFAKVEDEALAAGLVAARFGKEAIYMYGGSSTLYRADGAAALLQFEAMRWARGHGCDTYDLWGIPEQDPETPPEDRETSVDSAKGKDMSGLQRFKVGFGDEIVTYPAMLERRHVPVLPWLARKLHAIEG